MGSQTPEGRKGRPPRLAGIRVDRSPRSRSRRGGNASGNGGVARAPAHRPTLGWSRSRARKGKGKGAHALARSASEPALWLSAHVHAAPDDDPPSPPPPPLERPHTCYDVFDPASPFGRSASAASLAKLNSSAEEAKVVVSVTVEGSVGPVKTMVRLGASVREAIAAVVERYAREGRSPRLDPAAADSFQLYHSYFSLESLNKNDKIGDVGGRSFYLHKNGRGNGLSLQNAEPDANSGGGEIALNCGGQLSSAPYHYQVLTIVIKKLDKIGRRTKRIWRFITCDNCT